MTVLENTSATLQEKLLQKIADNEKGNTNFHDHAVFQEKMLKENSYLEESNSTFQDKVSHKLESLKWTSENLQLEFSHLSGQLTV